MFCISVRNIFGENFKNDQKAWRLGYHNFFEKSMKYGYGNSLVDKAWNFCITVPKSFWMILNDDSHKISMPTSFLLRL